MSGPPAAGIPAQPEGLLVAPLGLRAAAWLIDLAIVALVAIFFPPTDHAALVVLTFFIVYHAVLIGLLQQTAGKALLGLKVERLGKTPSFLWSLARASLGYCAVDLFGIGILPAFFNRDHRCFHDYVFGSRVLLEGTEKVRFRVLLSRLAGYCERQKTAESLTTAAKLGGLWAFLGKLAHAVQWFVDHVLGATKKAAVKAGAGPLPFKMSVIAATLSTAVAASAVIYVPPVVAIFDRLLTPRVNSQPPEGWGVCECPSSHPYIGVIYKGQRWHKPGYTCP